jgi:hypothetical protein
MIDVRKLQVAIVLSFRRVLHSPAPIDPGSPL